MPCTRDIRDTCCMRRQLADETEPLASGSFQLPADAFARVPVAEAESPTKAQAAGLQGTGLEYLAGAGVPPRALEAAANPGLPSPSLAGTGLESLISPPASMRNLPFLWVSPPACLAAMIRIGHSKALQPVSCRCH